MAWKNVKTLFIHTQGHIGNVYMFCADIKSQPYLRYELQSLHTPHEHNFFVASDRYEFRISGKRTGLGTAVIRVQ